MWARSRSNGILFDLTRISWVQIKLRYKCFAIVNNSERACIPRISTWRCPLAAAVKWRDRQTDRQADTVPLRKRWPLKVRAASITNMKIIANFDHRRSYATCVVAHECQPSSPRPHHTRSCSVVWYHHDKSSVVWLKCGCYGVGVFGLGIVELCDYARA